jgi:hypothetical protein
MTLGVRLVNLAGDELADAADLGPASPPPPRGRQYRDVLGRRCARRVFDPGRKR